MNTLTLNEYQARAISTDRTRGVGNGFDLAVLGLFGEIGGLLSEVKKKQRDSRSYLGYEGSVIEEMGDALWYLAVIADHAGINLAEIADSRIYDDRKGASASEDRPFASIQPQQTLPLRTP